MYRFAHSLFVLALAASTLASCSRRGADNAPAVVATPEVTIDRTEAPVTSPLEMTYRFVVLPNETLANDYTVFVHFLDADGELLWTDDHQPPVPTTQWKAGTPVEYQRTMFIPKFPYEGTTYVEVGLYLPPTGERVKMDGESTGQRGYRVASFNMRLQSEAPFMVFTDGWHNAEVSADGAGGVEWQWTRKEGTLAFKNPGRDATLYLEVDQPVQGHGAQKAEIRLGDRVLDSIDLTSGQRQLRKIALTRDQLGTADTVTLTVVPDTTFIPASVPELKNPDTRELGVRVFRAYLQPK
jgi:hypothetical protein